MQLFETRKNYVLGPAPRLLRREGAMSATNPNWICIEGSEPRTIVEAIRGYAQSNRAEIPEEHEVALVRHECGLFGVFFSPQLNPWVFANLVSWLGDPRILEGGSGACGWTRAGRDQSRYLFQVDRTNPSEDTVVVLGERGNRLELFLPDGSLCPTAKVATRVLEPVLDGGSVELLENFRVPLETSREQGNPNFLITRPINFDWSRCEDR
ncbi:MAG: hypothetical protein R3F20_05060 [Planctomycetota bacterium]